MFVLMEPGNQQFMDTGEKSRTGSDVHNLESQQMFCSVSGNPHYTAESKMDKLHMEDEHDREEKTGVVNYKIIEKHASDPCLMLRIAMTKENPSITITKKEKPLEEDTHIDQKYDDQIDKYTATPGLWRPSRRKKKNFYTGKRKKSWRQECMVPGCFTRAYSSRFVEFPDDTERRIDWANRTRLNEKFPGVDPAEPLPLRIGLCMGHFRNEDFHILPRGDGKICTLKEGVNPTIFPWVELPSNVSSGMDIFHNTKFSREMRLLNLMKSELYRMMNPPVKSYDKSPVLHDLPRKTELLNSEQKIMSDGNEIPYDTSKAGETRDVCRFSRRVKSRVPIYSGEIIIGKSNDIPQDSSKVGGNFENVRNFPRKSKIRLPNTFENNSKFGTPLVLRPRRSSRILKDKRAKCRNQYNRNRKKKKVAASISNEDCMYDIKIENCEEDEIPEVHYSVEESNTSLATDPEQQLFGGFNHFLAPYSNATPSTELPSQEVLGPVSAQIIASCVEAAMNPVMAKLELFQGRVEGRIEQLEGKVNSLLENLEGRVNSCSEKLEHLINNQHPKASNVFPGSWLNRCDQMSDNSSVISNGLAAPVHHMEVSIKPFAISEREYEMMEREDAP